MYYHVYINKKKYIFMTLCLFLLIIIGYLYLHLVANRIYLFPDCIFKQTFHLYCPGCGVTHAMNSLLQFDILSAFLYHPPIIYIVFLLCFFYIKVSILIIKNHGVAEFDIHAGWLMATLVLLAVFFIGRDILLVKTGFDYTGELATYWAK